MARARTVALHRDAHLFASRPDLAAEFERKRTRILLAPDQLLHAEAEMAFARQHSTSTMAASSPPLST